MGTLIILGRITGNAFINYDDGVYVDGNPLVERGLTLAGFFWAFTTGHAGNWHPLTWISHMMDCQFYGLKPAGHHLTSLLFHTANVLLLFVVLRRMTGTLWRSALVAALFAWHPLHVESVAWVAERKDVLSAFFFMLTLLAYARYVREASVRGPKLKVFYGLALFLFALGLMSKPMLVTLPFVLLLLDYWPLNRMAASRGDSQATPDRRRIASLVLEKVPFFLLSLISSIVTFWVQKKGGAVISVRALPLSQRGANAAFAIAGYFRKMLWPSDLSVFYPLSTFWSFYRLAATVGFLLIVSAIAIVWWRRRPYLLVGWSWFLGTLVPVLGLVQVGIQSMADRYTYIPLVGLFIALTWGAAEFLEGLPMPPRRPLAVAFILPVLVACLALTWQQAGFWKDSETLFRHALAVTTNNASAHVNLSQAFEVQGKLDDARGELQKALAIEPRYPVALNGLGVVLMHQGDATNAARAFAQALSLQPTFGEAHYNLGNALVKQGRFAEAAPQYVEALRLEPDDANVNVHYNLGVVLVQLGRLDEAASQLKTALRFDPNHYQALAYLGEVALRKGNLDEARRDFSEALRLKPGFAEAQWKLGTIRLRQGDLNQAITNFLEATRLDPRNEDAWFNLGGAYAMQNNLPSAANAFAQAARLRPDDADARDRLGAVLSRQGKLAEAIDSYRQALHLRPNDSDIYARLATAFSAQGNQPQALNAYHESLRLNPDNSSALRELAWLLATSLNAEIRNGPEAVRLAERARSLDRANDLRSLSALDAAYAEAGRFDDAIKTATQVRQLALSSSQTNLAVLADQRLDLYRAGKPYRE